MNVFWAKVNQLNYVSLLMILPAAGWLILIAIAPARAQMPGANYGMGGQPYQGYSPNMPPSAMPSPMYAPAGPSPQERRVARLEKKVFGSMYPEHEIDDRVEHLEREEFGQAQSGDLDARLARLEAKLGAGAFSEAAPGSVGRSMPPGLPVNNSPPAWMPTRQAAPAVPTFATDTPQPIIPAHSYPQVSSAQQPVFMGDLKPEGLPAQLPGPQPIGSASGGEPLQAEPHNQGNAGTPAAALPAANMTALSMPQKAVSATPAPRTADDAGFALSEFQTAVASIPGDDNAGNYLSSIDHYPGGCYAHWMSFPVRVHIPQKASPVWKEALEAAIRAWGQNIPLMVVPVKDRADIEVAWINHLPPKQLGITNLEVFNGQMRATIYLLRPDSYPPRTSQNVLTFVAEHELGHALGLWGHSPNQADVMHLPEALPTKLAGISQRDINTLKKVYQSPGLPDGFEIPQPVGWTCKYQGKTTR